MHPAVYLDDSKDDISRPAMLATYRSRLKSHSKHLGKKKGGGFIIIKYILFRGTEAVIMHLHHLFGKPLKGAGPALIAN